MINKPEKKTEKSNALGCNKKRVYDKKQKKRIDNEAYFEQAKKQQKCKKEIDRRNHVQLS